MQIYTFSRNFAARLTSNQQQPALGYWKMIFVPPPLNVKCERKLFLGMTYGHFNSNKLVLCIF